MTGHIKRKNKKMQSRPIYLIAHRCNSIKRVKIAVRLGFNAIESDLQYRKKDKKIFVSHFFKFRVTHENWLEAMGKLLENDHEKFSLIMFDCKFASNNKAKIIDEILKKIKKTVHEKLNKRRKNPIHVIFSISSHKNGKGLMKISKRLLSHEGIAIDESSMPKETEKFYQKLKVNNCWYGEGIFNFGAKRIYPYIKEGCELRDKNGIIKKTYVWTLFKLRSIRKYLKEAKVDGVMVEIPPFRHELKKVIKIVEELPGIHLARRNEPIFSVHKGK